MALEKLMLPHEQRSKYQKKLEELLTHEFSPDDFARREFIEALWLSVQSLSGPAESAMVIRECQILR
ncbi:hypothetical protein SAMN04487787_108112 [Kosakonia sacchari]|nr:hypothetical protein SAMN04487787_108112 [Kosakonia sacchari]